MSKVSNGMRTLGTSTHAIEPREKDDFYATPDRAVDVLLEKESFDGVVWENSCGMGHISERLKHHGLEVISTDLVDRGYGEGGVDFLKEKEMRGKHIIINPPFKIAEKFIRHGLELMEEGSKMCVFLKITFLAGQARRKMYEEYPPKSVYISSSRLTCAKGGDFEKYKNGGAVEYAWYVWEKGYKGETVLDWVN